MTFQPPKNSFATSNKLHYKSNILIRKKVLPCIKDIHPVTGKNRDSIVSIYSPDTSPPPGLAKTKHNSEFNGINWPILGSKTGVQAAKHVLFFFRSCLLWNSWAGIQNSSRSIQEKPIHFNHQLFHHLCQSPKEISNQNSTVFWVKFIFWKYCRDDLLRRWPMFFENIY